MIRLILQAKDLEEGKPVETTDLFQKIPFIETEWPDGTVGSDIINNLESPRFMKSHLPYQIWKHLLEKHPTLKTIQTMRNPKDTLVSYYHHMRADIHTGAFHGTWDQFFEMFKEKRLPWGDYFEHTVNWYKFNKDRKESLVLVYEEMKKSHRDHVLKIAKFLGYDISDKVTDTIVEKTSLNAMSKDFNDMLKESPAWKSDRAGFIRKGEIGDSEGQSEFVDAKCKEYLEPLGIIKFEYGQDI